MIFNSQGDAELRQYINGQTITPGEEEITLPGKSYLLGDVKIAPADTEAAYQEGYNAGYAAGYEVGYEEGQSAALPYSRELAYIEGDGAAHINSEYYPKSEKFRVKLDFMYVGSPGGKCAMGTQDGNGFSMTLYGTNEIIVGSNGEVTRTSRPVNTRFLFDVTADNGVVSGTENGNAVSGSYTGTIVKTKPFYIFHNNGGASSQICKMRVYSGQIYDNDILVRDYIPVLDYGGVACLYDKVEKKLYYNAGSGSFSYAEATKPYAMELEYIATSGAQYVNTGIIGKTGLKIEGRFSPSNLNFILAGCFSPKRCYLLNATAAGVLRYGYIDWVTSSFTIKTGQWYDFETDFTAGNQYLKINGELVVSSTITTEFANNYNVFLFAYNDGGNAGDYFTGKAGPFKVYDNGTLVRDYIPVLDLSGVACLFDKVEQKFYYNQGSGSFTYAEAA